MKNGKENALLLFLSLSGKREKGIFPQAPQHHPDFGMSSYSRASDLTLAKVGLQCGIVEWFFTT